MLGKTGDLNARSKSLANQSAFPLPKSNDKLAQPKMNILRENYEPMRKFRKKGREIYLSRNILSQEDRSILLYTSKYLNLFYSQTRQSSKDKIRSYPSIYDKGQFGSGNSKGKVFYNFIRIIRTHFLIS